MEKGPVMDDATKVVDFDVATLVRDLNKNISAHVQVVRPDDARRYLENMFDNRKPSAKRVTEYARYMSEGQWLLNGEPLIFDNSGRMIDGQHRCLACVKADVSFPVLVVSGVDRDAVETINVGLRRSRVHVGQIAGVENAQVAMPAAARLVSFQRTGDISVNPSVAPSEHQLVQIAKAEPNMNEACRVAGRVSSLLSVSSAAMAALYVLLKARKPEECEAFFSGLETGLGFMSASHPIWMCREYLRNNKPTGDKSDQRYRVAIVVRAWNLYATDRTAKTLRGPINNVFPPIYPYSRVL